mgnify:CR=1 FL=1
MCHGHTNPRLRQSTNDEARTDNVMNVQLDLIRLETREVGSDEMTNLRCWERDKRMKTEIKIKETRWSKREY